MQKNSELWFKILKKYRTQAAFAVAIGQAESKVSRILNGYHRPNDDDRQTWAEALDCKPEDVFKD